MVSSPELIEYRRLAKNGPDRVRPWYKICFFRKYLFQTAIGERKCIRARKQTGDIPVGKIEGAHGYRMTGAYWTISSNSVIRKSASVHADIYPPAPNVNRISR